MARALVAESIINNADELHGRRPVKYELNRRRLVGRAAQRREKMIAFGYYGGKFSHLDFILPLLPTTYRHYCEPFGGSAAVLINRKPPMSRPTTTLTLRLRTSLHAYAKTAESLFDTLV